MAIGLNGVLSMQTELLHIGFGNVLSISRVVAIVSPNSAPSKRLVQEGKTEGRIIDMTSGRRTKAVLVMDTGHIVLAAIAPDTIARRVAVSDRLIASGEVDD
ncbi:MAG: hypothetical protein DK306_001249 [Chloroflexi bacterium]|jgi:regulator of extracellular matrix RemA (YlzA/DUF370 family)|nr:MAG: hypothetical protein DK306_001249 [Chloroflexota bacterium]